jgi:hypothetical protein
MKKIIVLMLLMIVLRGTTYADTPTPTVTRTSTPSAVLWFQITATPTSDQLALFRTKVNQLSNFGESFQMLFDIYGYKHDGGIDVLMGVWCPLNKLATLKTKVINTLADWNITTYKTLTGTAIFTDPDVIDTFKNGRVIW